MKLVSVNIGRPRPVAYRDGVVDTGIYKVTVAGPIWVRRLNLDGDGQADLRVHGGVDKAVYAYPFEHYAFWARELGRNDLSTVSLARTWVHIPPATAPCVVAFRDLTRREA